MNDTYLTEQIIIGSLLYDNSVFDKIEGFLAIAYFQDSVHKKAYEKIRDLINKNRVASIHTIAPFLAQEIENPIEYLASVQDSIISLSNILDYAQQLYEAYLRRQLVQIGSDISQKAVKNYDVGPCEQINQAEEALFRIASINSLERDLVQLKHSISGAIDSIEKAFQSDTKIIGTPTGFKMIDLKLGGLHNSDLIIVAGRPSMGKSAFAMDIAYNAAKSLPSKAVAFFSLEMSAEQLSLRLLSQVARIPSDRMRRGELKADDFSKIIEAGELLCDMKLFIDDTPAITVSTIRARARRMVKNYPLALIVIDYLQLINSSVRIDNRVNEISQISRDLKAVAKELNVPVIALSQLSRAVEQRDDKRPMLADLRESGSIEQDADVVMFVYREEYYLQRKKPEEDTQKFLEWQQKMSMVHNRADIIIAKQRHGPIGNVLLKYEGEYTKFSDMQ